MILAALFALGTVAQATPADSASSLIGTWQCVGSNGQRSGTAVLTGAPPQISMTYRYTGLDGAAYELDATFHYDAASAAWTLREPAGEFTAFVGRAGAWTDQLWTFAGADAPLDPGDSMFDEYEHAQMTFVSLGRNAFEMIRSQQWGGQWVSHDPWTSSVLDVICTRSGAPERGNTLREEIQP